MLTHQAQQPRATLHRSAMSCSPCSLVYLNRKGHAASVAELMVRYEYNNFPQGSFTIHVERLRFFRTLYWTLFTRRSTASADQIALLVAGINYVLEVEATLERVVEGDNSALAGYYDLQVSRYWNLCQNPWLRLPWPTLSYARSPVLTSVPGKTVIELIPAQFF